MPVENYVIIDIQELIKIIANASNQFKKKILIQEIYREYNILNCCILYDINIIHLILFYFIPVKYEFLQETTFLSYVGRLDV